MGNKYYETMSSLDNRSEAKRNKTRSARRSSMPSSRGYPGRKGRAADRGGQVKEWPQLPREGARILCIRARSGPGTEVKPGLTRLVRPGLTTIPGPLLA